MILELSLLAVIVICLLLAVFGSDKEYWGDEE